MEYNQAEFLYETEVPHERLIVSRTDLNGIITYANDTFLEISGYTKEELIGQSHSIIRHPDMPSSVFKDLWETITQEKKWHGKVKNIRKDGGFYWVHATISGVYKDGFLTEYKSIRVPVTFDDKITTQKEYDLIKQNSDEPSRHIVYK